MSSPFQQAQQFPEQAQQGRRLQQRRPGRGAGAPSRRPGRVRRDGQGGEADQPDQRPAEAGEAGMEEQRLQPVRQRPHLHSQEPA